MKITKKIINTEPEYIIHPSMYNNLDYTTDMSCIQKPDQFNLFPGFNKNEFKLNVEKEIIVDPVKKVDDLVVEKFDNNNNELNELHMPYNSIVLDPYENYKMVKNKPLGEDKCSENSGNDLCFHCRKGYCLGGVCRNIFEPEPGKLLLVLTNTI